MMDNLQEKAIELLRVKSEISDWNAELRKRINFLKRFLRQSGARGFVLGLSGGVDSALSGWIASQAVKELSKITGHQYFLETISMPYNVQSDIDDLPAIVDYVMPDLHSNINIAKTVDGLMESFQDAGMEPSDFNKGNAKARARMMSLYLYAAERRFLVLGSDNAAEMLTGFFTKFGDGGYDVNPIQSLNKRQVRAAIAHTGGPEFLVNKIPTADLLDSNSMQADEDELGISYDALDDFLEGKRIRVRDESHIEKLFIKSEHKRLAPFGL